MILKLIRRRHERAKQQFDGVVGKALQSAEQGRVEKALSLVEQAQHLSDQNGFEFNQAETDFIRNIAYRSGLDASLSSARYWATNTQIGDVDTAMKYVQRARKYLPQAPINRDEKITKTKEIDAIEVEIYKNGVERNLYRATRDLQGEHSIIPFDVLRNIREARLYARHAGLDVSEIAKQLRKETAVKGVEVYLGLAREEADRGYLIGFKRSLRRARRFAQLSGADVSQQLHEIEPVAYANRARLDGIVAGNYRMHGYANRAILWEEMARTTAATAQMRVNGSIKTIDDVVIY